MAISICYLFFLMQLSPIRLLFTVLCIYWYLVREVVHDTVYNGRDHGVHTHDHPVISLGIQNDNSSNDHGGSRDNLGRHSVQVDASSFRWSFIFLLQFRLTFFCLATPTCKAVGVQTDKSWDSTPLCSKTDLSTRQHCQSKLLTVWDSPKVQGSPRNLVSKLLVACETDFHILFGCLGLSAKASSISLAVERSDVGLQDQKPASQSAEAAKVSHLYSMLTKVLFLYAITFNIRHGSRLYATFPFWSSMLPSLAHKSISSFQLECLTRIFIVV